MAVWEATKLEGELVRLEPMSAEHEEGLWEASRDPETWRWLSVFKPETREQMHRYVERALAAQAAGIEMPFTTIRQEDGRVLGSTRYLELRPEHRSLEIGWTWLTPDSLGNRRQHRGKAADAWRCLREAGVPPRGAED